MFRNTFYRNVRARDLLDAFLISAITSLLLVRFYLYLTGFPQLGSGPLHIAHMLYGGVFMMLAIVLMLSFIGSRVRQTAAVIGGAGFGIFIDELGKFITEDNNYFFKPTIGLIYAVFVILYLSFNFLTRAQRLTSREYQLNALAELEEAVAHDMDKAEKARIGALIDASDSKSNVTKQLRILSDNLEISASEKPSRLYKFFRKVDETYKRFWQRRNSHFFVGALFTVEVIILVSGVVYTAYTNIDDVKALFDGSATYGEEVLVAQILSSAVAAGFVLYGLIALKSSRLKAFEYFRRATLINIYLTQFFVFIRIQFDALPGLVLNLVVLLLITFVLRQEARLGKKHAPAKR